MLLLMILILAGVCLAALWMADPSLPAVGDINLQAMIALPSSTTAVTSPAIDTGARSANAIAPRVEVLLTAPAVSTAQLPDGKTLTYSIVQSANPDLSAATPLSSSAIVQTGAGGAGAAAASVRVDTPSTCARYVGFNVTPPASGTGDASATTATMQMVF